MKCIIIGGVAGGATTAARLRRMDENAEIILLERGQYVSYANCGLPYYIGGAIQERDRLFVQTPEGFKKRFRVDIRVQNEALSIDPQKKEVEIKDLTTGKKYRETYDKLVLSPGASPIRPDLPGIDSKKIFTLRDVADTDRIMQFIEEKRPQSAAVIGAGFIGLEMAENLHARGLKVCLVELAEQVMPPVDFDIAAAVHQHLKSKEVAFHLGVAAKSFIEKDGKLEILLGSGKKIQVDMAILSIGIRPENTLAKNAGIKIGERGGIEVNEYMETSEKNIYAVGDAVEFPHPITKKSAMVFLAGPANKQGRIAASNIVFGNKTKYKGSLGTAIAKVFDLTIGCTGLSEKALKAGKIPFISAVVHAGTHAGYYPNASVMTLKIHFDPLSGSLLGAQAVGFDGIDKRMDLLSSMIQRKGTVIDLSEFEHAYAPPYSSAKDPVNMAGFIGENIISHKMQVVTWKDVENRNNEVFLLDVRTLEEYELGKIEGAVNIPVDNLRERMGEIPREKKIYVYCGVGLRAYVACRILSQNGFADVHNVTGGIKTYNLATQKQSNEKDFLGTDDTIYVATSVEKTHLAKEIREVDACGLQCPGPIIRLKNEMEKTEIGQQIRIRSTDAGFLRDAQAWCDLSGNKIISLTQEKGEIVAVIEKQENTEKEENMAYGANKTLVVFSQDLDRALAAFVIANGAASTGRKVTMFFTFWGLNIIKKVKKPYVKKDLMGTMFGWMLPSSSLGLKLSKMNMLGIGTKMMRWRMESLRIDTLEKLIKTAVENNVEMIGCQMSMDVMGVKKEELLDNVVIGGVATYLKETEQANLNLFI